MLSRAHAEGGRREGSGSSAPKVLSAPLVMKGLRLRLELEPKLGEVGTEEVGP